MHHIRRDGREGVENPLGKLAIDQTSRAVRYVPATHKCYNTRLVINLAMRSKSKYRPRATARVVRVVIIKKNNATGGVPIIRAWLNQCRDTYTARIRTKKMLLLLSFHSSKSAQTLGFHYDEFL